MTSAPAIGFEYRPSRWPGRAVWLVTALAMASLWLSNLSPWLVVPLNVVLLGVLVSRWRAWERSPLSAAGWGRDQLWSLRLCDGSDCTAALVSHRVLGEALIWLALRDTAGRTYPLLLAPDNADADTRRRLRMRLWVMRAQAASAEHGTLSVQRGPRA